MSKKQETAPVVQQTTALEIPEELAGTWGAGEHLDSSDFKIAKIWHMQGLSDLVVEERAAAGDWVDSNTKDIICVKAKPLSVIIFDSFKNIIVSRKGRNDEKWKFDKYIEATPENILLPWEEEDRSDAFGGKIKRQLQYNYFCLLPEFPDRMPYVLSMSSTKVQTAKILNNALGTLAKIMKKPSAAYIFTFTSVLQKGEKGSWQGAEVKQGAQTPIELLTLAKHWYDTLKVSKYTIVEDESEHSTEAAAVETPSSASGQMDDGYMDSLQNQS